MGKRRHEFGDTRHRYVSYHLEATTRYREYFPPEITSDPKNIQRIGPLKSIHVPSSARPAALKPLYILPTYRWSDDLPEDPDGEMGRDDPHALGQRSARLYGASLVPDRG